MNTAFISKHKNRQGFSLPELLIVMLIIAILIVLALPQIISSRRLVRFSGMQRQVVSSLREARQDAVSQRTAITFRYNNADKNIVIYGGKYGAAGDAKNRIVSVAGEGLDPSEVIYGRPSVAPVSALGDGANITALTQNIIEIKFQADGSVVDNNDAPANNALFFYNVRNAAETSFAVSILGAGGRVKVWRYSKGVNAYIE